MKFGTVLREELARLFRRKSFYVAFALFFAYCMYGVIHAILGDLETFWMNAEEMTKDVYFLSAAHTKFILDDYMIDGFLNLSVAALLCTLPFADSYFTENNTGVVQLVFAKAKRAYYYIAKLIAVFVGNLLVYTIPLLANQLALFSFYRVTSEVGVNNSESLYTYSNFLIYNYALSPSLAVQHPYLYNLCSGLIFAAFFALLGCATFCLSYYVRRYQAILYAAPFVLCVGLQLLDMLTEGIVPENMFFQRTVQFGLTDYLATYANGLHDSFWYFLLLCAALCAFVVFATRAQCKRDTLK